MTDVHSLVPRHKCDLDRANAVVAAGYPAVEPILPDLLEWLQDYNWPVAQVLAPFLASLGSPLVPHVRHILDTDDEVWKYWLIVVILTPSLELATAFRHELERLAWSPGEREAAEELNLVARDVLEKYGWLGQGPDQ